MTATWHREKHRHVTWRLKDDATKREIATVLYLGFGRWHASHSIDGRSNFTVRGTATAARQSAEKWLDRISWEPPEITNPAWA